MSNTTVVSRRDMKEPDKFQTVAGQAAGWVAGHKKQVYAALVVLAVGVAVVIAGSAWQTHREEKAGAALSEAAGAIGGQVSSVPLPGQPGPFFATEVARQEAIAQATEKVRKDYPSSDAANTAALIAASARLRLGQWDAAVSGYQAFLAGTRKDDAMRSDALEGIALAEEGSGRLDAAVLAYERMAKEVPAEADRADLGRSRVLARSGKVEEARKILSGFGEAHKESALLGEAADQLSRLGK
jgi:hypothetical protein